MRQPKRGSFAGCPCHMPQRVSRPAPGKRSTFKSQGYARPIARPISISIQPDFMVMQPRLLSPNDHVVDLPRIVRADAASA